MIELSLALIIGFALGYAFRDTISIYRRRRYVRDPLRH